MLCFTVNFPQPPKTCCIKVTGLNISFIPLLPSLEELLLSYLHPSLSKITHFGNKVFGKPCFQNANIYQKQLSLNWRHHSRGMWVTSFARKDLTLTRKVPFSLMEFLSPLFQSEYQERNWQLLTNLGIIRDFYEGLSVRYSLYIRSVIGLSNSFLLQLMKKNFQILYLNIICSGKVLYHLHDKINYYIPAFLDIC